MTIRRLLVCLISWSVFGSAVKVEEPIDLTALSSNTLQLLNRFREFEAVSRGLSLEEYSNTRAFSSSLEKRTHDSLYEYYFNHLFHLYKYSSNGADVAENYALHIFLASLVTRGFEATVPAVAPWDTFKSNPQFKDKPTVDEIFEVLTAQRSVSSCRSSSRPVPFFGGKYDTDVNHDGHSEHMMTNPWRNGNEMHWYNGPNELPWSLSSLLTRALDSFPSSPFAALDVTIKQTNRAPTTVSPSLLALAQHSTLKSNATSPVLSSNSTSSHLGTSTLEASTIPAFSITTAEIELRSASRWPEVNAYPQRSTQAHVMIGVLILCMAYMHVLAVFGLLASTRTPEKTFTPLANQEASLPGSSNGSLNYTQSAESSTAVSDLHPISCLSRAIHIKSLPLTSLGWATLVSSWFQIAQGVYLLVWVSWLLLETNPIALRAYVSTDAMELQHVAIGVAMLGAGFIDAVYARTLPREGEPLGNIRDDDSGAAGDDPSVELSALDHRENISPVDSQTSGFSSPSLSFHDHVTVAWYRLRTQLLLLLPICTCLFHITVGINLYHHPQHSADSVWEHQLLAILLFTGAVSSLYSRICGAEHAPLKSALQSRLSAEVGGLVGSLAVVMGAVGYIGAGLMLALFEEPPESMHFQHYYLCFEQTQYVWTTVIAGIVSLGMLGYLFFRAVRKSYGDANSIPVGNKIVFS